MKRLALVGLKTTLAYPSDALVHVLRGPIVILAYASIWTTLALSVGTSSQRELILYVAATMFLATLPMWEIRGRIEGEIRSGALAGTLTQPVDPTLRAALLSMGALALGALSSFATFLAVYVVLGGQNIHMFLIAALLHALFSVLLASTIGYLAAWTYRTWGVYSFVTYFLGKVFGGTLAPLDILPDWIQAVSAYLPFRYTTYAVAKLVTGGDAGFLPILAAWVGIMAIIERLVKRAAIRRLEVWGG